MLAHAAELTRAGLTSALVASRFGNSHRVKNGAMRAKDVLIPAVMLGGIAGYAWSALPPAAVESSDERARIEQSVHYSGCNEVRAAGKAPLYAGQPGYRPEMDGDSDGIACEPYRGR
jgi:hypothetical protein